MSLPTSGSRPLKNQRRNIAKRTIRGISNGQLSARNHARSLALLGGVTVPSGMATAIVRPSDWASGLLDLKVTVVAFLIFDEQFCSVEPRMPV